MIDRGIRLNFKSPLNNMKSSELIWDRITSDYQYIITTKGYT